MQNSTITQLIQEDNLRIFIPEQEAILTNSETRKLAQALRVKYNFDLEREIEDSEIISLFCSEDEESFSENVERELDDAEYLFLLKF